MRQSQWSEYVDHFHHDHPGITEEALHHASDPTHHTPYDWLAAGLPDHLGRVLDCACGTMPMQVHLADKADFYAGVDLSFDEARAGLELGRGPVANAGVLALPIASHSVDTLVMSMSLMLVPLREALAEITRVLAPGGRFAALIPATWPISPRDVPATAALSAVLLGPGSMPRHLTAGRLRAALTDAGFTDMELESRRFPFRIRRAADADLAVRSLYTPGRSRRQLALAAAVLDRLPDWCELPVPLTRVTARLPRRSPTSVQ